MRVMISACFGGANGIETYNRHLVRGLQDHGHEVVLAEATEADCDISAMHRLQLRRRAWKFRRLVGPFESYRSHAKLRAGLSDFGCDILHATYPETIPLRASKIPIAAVVWHPVGSLIARTLSSHLRGESTRSEFLFAASDRLALTQADALLPVSSAATSALQLYRTRRVDWVPPFLPDSYISRSRRRPNGRVVMIASILDSPRKGLKAAVTAVSLLARSQPGVELVLVGRWHNPPALPDFCTWAGFRSSEEITQLLSTAGALIIPSKFEEFGFVGLEALAAGCPVVCTQDVGLVGLSTNGIVVSRSREASDLADALAVALSISEVEYPAACRSSNAIPRLISIYEGLLK